MRKLDNNLLATCSILGKVTKERAECLKAFIKCKPLVDWLTESMPGNSSLIVTFSCMLIITRLKHKILCIPSVLIYMDKT